MRCKLHPYANALGVCAPCLRDRLLVLAAERDRAGADCSSSGSSRAGSPKRGRSVSPAPLQQHRRSDACAYTSSRRTSHRPELLFFSTPQVGPATRAADDDEPRASERKRSAHRRRSFLAALFGGGRRRGRREEDEAGSRKEEDDPPRRSVSASWLSAMVRRKQRPVDASSASLPRPVDEEPESPVGSTSSWWFPSPSPARHRHHRRSRPGGSGASGDGISGLGVCLSPLVRPSSGGRRRCQPSDPSSQGESHRRHMSAGSAASFGRNTSRKLADMGRFR